MSTTTSFFKSQLFVSLPYPTKKFTGQTIIVTGSNIGMGLEAARHFVRLDAAKVILAVRNTSAGLAAQTSIETSEKRLGVVEVWELDLARYTSVKSFAKRAEQLERLDVVVANAGIYTFDFAMAEEDEVTITVNVVSTLLLGILLVPKLRESAVKFGTVPVLTFTGSFTHAQTPFPERKSKEGIFEGLKVREGARMNDRYKVSKLIQLLLIRELASEVSKSRKQGRVIVSTINPGFVDTAIMREAGFLYSKLLWVLKRTLSRSAEVGSRTLVSAAEGGDETHGQYLDDCKVGLVSAFVRSEEGLKTQKSLWKELEVKLEKIQPGVMCKI